MRSDTKHIAPCGNESRYTCRMHCVYRLVCDHLSRRAKASRQRAEEKFQAWLEKLSKR